MRVIAGAVFDVAVDLRGSSETFGQWVGIELSADNKNSYGFQKDLLMAFMF